MDVERTFGSCSSSLAVSLASSVHEIENKQGLYTRVIELLHALDVSEMVYTKGGEIEMYLTMSLSRTKYISGSA